MISLAYALGPAGGLRLTVSERPGAQPDACRGSEGAAPHAADLARRLSSSPHCGVAPLPCAGHDRGIVEIANGVGESAQVRNRHPWAVGHGIGIRDLLLVHAASVERRHCEEVDEPTKTVCFRRRARVASVAKLESDEYLGNLHRPRPKDAFGASPTDRRVGMSKYHLEHEFELGKWGDRQCQMPRPTGTAAPPLRRI